MLEIDAVNQYYGGSHILRGVSLQVQRGQVLALLGRNGVGKTTLLKALMGLVPIRGGAIRLDGARIDRLRPEQRARLGIGYVPQGREIFARLTVAENLQMGLAAAGGRGRVPDELFDLFPVLAQMRARRGGDLSGGQQQQLAIARALAARPRLLVLDEPTEGIQPSIVQAMVDRIGALRRSHGLSVLLVEQNLDFIRGLADRVALIHRGRIVREFPREELDDPVLVEEFIGTTA